MNISRLTIDDLTPHDVNDVIQFARTWNAFGGGDAHDIFVTFGIPACEYFRRLLLIVDADRGQRLSVRDRDALREVCRQRLPPQETALPTF